MNYLAILVSVIASIVIGSIWYGPLFGKMFMEANGMNAWSPERKEAEKKRMPWAYVGQFVSSAIMMFVLDGLFVWTAPKQNVYFGVWLAFFMWLGFVAPVQFGQQIWGGKISRYAIPIYFSPAGTERARDIGI